MAFIVSFPIQDGDVPYYHIYVSLPEGNVPDHTRTSVSKNSIVRRLEPLTKNEFSTQHISATAKYTPGKEKVFICHVFFYSFDLFCNTWFMHIFHHLASLSKAFCFKSRTP